MTAALVVSSALYALFEPALEPRVAGWTRLTTLWMSVMNQRLLACATPRLVSTQSQEVQMPTQRRDDGGSEIFWHGSGCPAIRATLGQPAVRVFRSG